MSGYVLIHRDLWGHPVFRNAVEAAAFARLVSDAAWQDTRVRYKGAVIALQRGQVAISTRDLATLWGWSEATARRYLARLEADGMVAKNRRTTDASSDARKDAAVTVLTICNYSEYQASGKTADAPEDAPFDDKATQDRRSSDAQNKEGNEYITSSLRSEDEKRATARRATRIPADAILPAAWQRWASDEGHPNPEREWQKFTDYWRAQPGQKGVKLDWEATWRNWVRRAVEDGKRFGAKPQPAGGTGDRLRAGLAGAVARRLDAGRSAAGDG